MRYPHIDSLQARALLLLLNGHRISHRDFQNETASYRLSHFIYALREKGWMVLDVEECRKTSDPTGRKATFKRYFLAHHDIQHAGENGCKFVSCVQEWVQKRKAAA